MKVLMVTPFYYPTIGGTESSIENMSIALNEMRVHTDIMTFDINRTWKPFSKAKIEEIHGVDVIRISAFDTRPLKAMEILFKMRFIPKSFTNQFENYDIIHFHNDVDLTFPGFSHFVAKPKIFHCHCIGVTFNLYKRNPLSRNIFRNVADIYITPSEYLLKYFDGLRIPRKKVRVLPNGIDVKKFQPQRETKIDNLLLFVGRLDPAKGLHVLLKSLEYLKTPVQLVIIGPRAQWARTYSEKILALVEKENKKGIHKITYMGALKHEEVIEWYQKAAIFVLPSLSESFGIVNLEALACETPVVASNAEGIPEVIHDHKNGILVPPNDAAKLADGIQYLLDNAEIRKKFCKEGRRWVIENFSSEAVAKRLCQIYEEIIR